MEVLLVVLFDSPLEGAGELAAIIGEDILYGEGEHHLDQLGAAVLPFNEQDYGIKGDTMAPRIGVRRFLPQRLRCLGLTGFRLPLGVSRAGIIRILSGASAINLPMVRALGPARFRAWHHGCNITRTFSHPRLG